MYSILQHIIAINDKANIGRLLLHSKVLSAYIYKAAFKTGARGKASKSAQNKEETG